VLQQAAARSGMNPDPTGLWFNPQESGWGLILTQQGPNIFAALFSYGTDGKAAWWVASNVVDTGQPVNLLVGEAFAGPLYGTTGPYLGAPDNTALAPQVTWTPTSFDYLLMQAVSRIYLSNIDHIQSSWVTQGMKIGQVALAFGADDMGSIMIEENVVSAAGTTYRASTADFVHTITNAGYVARQRDTLYRTVRDHAA